MNKIELFTIGFSKKNAQSFFEKLRQMRIVRLIDIRLNNTSQLSGFAKKDDLAYFLRVILDCDYLHEPLFAPTMDILNAYKKKEISWSEYERRFNSLMISRGVHSLLGKSDLHMACLLCSEPTAGKCHRRLVAEYLKKCLQDVEIVHL